MEYGSLARVPRNLVRIVNYDFLSSVFFKTALDMIQSIVCDPIDFLSCDPWETKYGHDDESFILIVAPLLGIHVARS